MDVFIDIWVEEMRGCNNIGRASEETGRRMQGSGYVAKSMESLLRVIVHHLAIKTGGLIKE